MDISIKQTVAQHDRSGDKGEDIRTIVFVSKEGGSCMKAKNIGTGECSVFLALAMVITQLGVWNAGKESVQAADTVIYQEDFSKSTDGWTPEWSVGSDLTTFAVGKNYAKDNDSSLNIWSKKAQVLTITHEVSAVEEGNYYVSLNTYGGSVNSGTISISDGTTEQSADIGFSDGLTEYKTKMH